MSRAELIQMLESQKKIQNRTGYWLLSYLVLFVLGVWASKHQNIIPEDTLTAILLIGLFGGIYGTLIVVAICTKKQREKLGLCCPRCKKGFVGISAQIVLAAGRCGRCGEIVLEDWNK